GYDAAAVCGLLAPYGTGNCSPRNDCFGSINLISRLAVGFLGSVRRFIMAAGLPWGSQTCRWEIVMDERAVRVALERHWDASDASDFEVEHEIYREDAVLDYPQSGERIRGRHNIQE